MKRFIYKTFLAASVVMLVVTACKKDDKNLPITDSDVSSATDNMVVEETFQDVATTTQEAFNGNLSNYGRYAGDTCVIITKDSANGRIEIDFGSGCTDKRNILRKGKIIINYSGGEFRDSGCHISVSFENFYHNGNKVEGTKTFDNKGKTNGHQVLNIQVTGGKVTFPDGRSISLSSNKTFEFMEGFETPTLFDDILGVNGSAQGSNRDSSTYTQVIKEQLIRDNTCTTPNSKPQFTKGILEYTPGTKATRVINFGDGTCDGKASLTIGSFSTTIDLK
jgi:hypothetical protein